jgi:hypothetical protein
VTSGQRDRASPSLSALCGHPRHCSTMRGAVATSRCCWDVRGQDVTATTAVPRAAITNGTLEPLSRDYAGSNHDAKPAVAPSPLLSTPCGRPCHAAHCCNYSNAVEHAGTGCRHACHCTSYGPLSTAPSILLGAALVNHYASTLEAAPIRVQDAPRRRDWSKIRRDGHQLYGTVRHTATRVGIVRHACHLPPPWSIKGRAAPGRAGQTRDDGQQTLTRSPPSPRYWHLPQSNLGDLEATPSLPPRL